MKIVKAPMKISMLVTAMMLTFSSYIALGDHHEVPVHIQKAVESVERTDRDRSRDAGRKPLEFLAFAGVKQGMNILDINSASGYYTELLSKAVGPKGSVIAHNSAVWWAFMRSTLPERYIDGHLENVIQLQNNQEEMELEEGSIDQIYSVLVYHSFFIKHRKRFKNENIPAILASYKKALKPGGSFIVVDHVAPAGEGLSASDKYHRIDPEIVKQQVLAAGFKLVETSDLLKNNVDDRTRLPFKREVSGKTDRFIMKFVK